MPPSRPARCQSCRGVRDHEESKIERNPAPTDDPQRLPRLIAGDRAVWAAFVRAEAPRLHAAARRILARARHRPSGAELEDVVQAVFLKLWADERRRLRTFQGRSRLSTWLVAITRREALDRLRRGSLDRRAMDRLHDEASMGAPRGATPPRAPDADAAARDLEGRLAEALRALPGRDRLLLTLVEVDDLTYAQAARLIGVRENSVGPLLQRARRKLRGLLPAEHAP